MTLLAAGPFGRISRPRRDSSDAWFGAMNITTYLDTDMSSHRGLTRIFDADPIQ